MWAGFAPSSAQKEHPRQMTQAGRAGGRGGGRMGTSGGRFGMQPTEEAGKASPRTALHHSAATRNALPTPQPPTHRRRASPCLAGRAAGAQPGPAAEPGHPPAMTSTSLGPAGMSMATMASLFVSSILAAVTNWLPGPKILSTFGTLCVPQAMAATACAPPALSRCVTPAHAQCPSRRRITYVCACAWRAA